MALDVSGGAGGAAARLEELDALAAALLDAAADCAALAARAAAAVLEPSMLTGAAVDPGGVALVVEEVAVASGELCRAAAEVAGLAGAVAAAVQGYRSREATVAALLRGVPLVVGAAVRARLTTGAVLLGAPVVGPFLRVAGGPVPAAVVLASTAPLREVLVERVVAHPLAVDAVVRLAPGVLGVPDVPAVARVLGGAGDRTGLLRRTPVTVERAGPAAPCAALPADPASPAQDAGPAGPALPAGPGGRQGVPAAGVADLLRRGQSVAAWREPRHGEHDTLPDGAARPSPGQVRVDRVDAPDGQVAWVVHVPGTQEWDGDGEGSPMDMAGNVGLVGGTPTAVTSGVAAAMVAAGVRPGQPVAVVGHSQGGMTALHLAADPGLRRVATITHVVTAGSPLAGRTPPPAVQVLALEHTDDLVPRLDGRDHPDRDDRVLVRSTAPDGPWRSDAVPAHSSSAYVATAAAVDASDHPSLVAHRQGMAAFLDRPGAGCTTQQFVLTRGDGRGGGPA